MYQKINNVYLIKNILDETMNVIDGIREFEKLRQVSLKGKDCINDINRPAI